MKRFWVVGAGYWGEILQKKIKETFEPEYIYVIDQNIENRNRLTSKYPYLIPSEFDELLYRGTKSDLYFVATPPDSHFQITQQLLSKQFSVWCEKPLTMDSSKAETLIELANSNKSTLFVDNTFLFDEGIEQLSIKLENLNPYKSRFTRKAPGKILKNIGVAWDLMPHDLSIASKLFGELKLKSIENITYVNLEDNVNVLTELTVILSSKKCEEIYFDLSSISNQKIRGINIIHKNGILGYEMFENTRKITDVNWSAIPGNHSSSNPSKGICELEVNEPLINALIEFNALSEMNSQHESLFSTAREIGIIEEVMRKLNE